VIGQPARKGLSPSSTRHLAPGLMITSASRKRLPRGVLIQTWRMSPLRNGGCSQRSRSGALLRVGLGRSLEGFKMQKVREVLLVFEPCAPRHIVIYTRNFESWSV
jgi:hypothetical protein